MPDNKDGKFQDKTRSYLKYSGLAFQLAGLIIAGLLIGRWLDNLLHLEKPYITMLLILVFFSGYMYKLYIELSRKP